MKRYALTVLVLVSILLSLQFCSACSSLPAIKAPSGLSAEALSSSSIRLTWTDNSDNETGFMIERSLSSSGDFTLTTTVEADETTFDDTGLDANTTYYYRVKAYNDDDESRYTEVMSATTEESPSVPAGPSAPGGAVAQALSSSWISLTWMDKSDNETGFKIERSLSIASGFTEIDTVGEDVTAYDDTGVDASTTYYYRVRAYNSAGGSSYSNTTRATTDPPPPPQTFTLTAVYEGDGEGGIVRIEDDGRPMTYGWMPEGSPEEFIVGTVVTLRASECDDCVFVSWDGCDSSDGDTCTVVMTEDKVITATFNALPTTVTIVGPPSPDDDGTYILEFEVCLYQTTCEFYVEESLDPSFSSLLYYDSLVYDEPWTGDDFLVPNAHQAEYTDTPYTYTWDVWNRADGTYWYRIKYQNYFGVQYSEPWSVTVSSS